MPVLSLARSVFVAALLAACSSPGSSADAPPAGEPSAGAPSPTAPPGSLADAGAGSGEPGVTDGPRGADGGTAAGAGTDASTAAPDDAAAAVTADTCDVRGGSGLPIFGPATTSASACQAQCDSAADAHPNRTCLWGLVDLAPLGSCQILGGIGADLFGPASTTEGECYTECAALAQPHPNRTCTWTGPSGAVNVTGS